jgi:RND family efflux transporter MFP subunit
MYFPRLLQPVFVTFVALAATLSGCSRGRQASATDEDEVSIVPVAAQPAPVGRLRAVLHISGVVTPVQGAEFLVVASEPARIVEMPRAEGDPVGAGDLLARFEAPAATQELARQRAEVARAQVQVENARIADARAKDLVARGLVARNQTETADRELADAQAQLTRAEAAQAAAEAAVGRAVIRAPFAGVIASKLHNVGDVAQATPTDPVLRLVDPKRVEVMATVPVADAARVQYGATARLASQVDGKQVRLSVAAAPNIAERSVDGNVRVRLGFLDPPDVPVDALVEVDVDAEERSNVVFLPPEALVKSGAETAVFVAVSDRAERRVVTTGVQDDQGIEITSGLEPGDLVITRGQAGLANGQQISVEITR